MSDVMSQATEGAVMYALFDYIYLCILDNLSRFGEM